VRRLALAAGVLGGVATALYARAKALGVERRSKMNKDQLRRAIDVHAFEGAPA
jgi:hypothetical protein